MRVTISRTLADIQLSSWVKEVFFIFFKMAMTSFADVADRILSPAFSASGKIDGSNH